MKRWAMVILFAMFSSTADADGLRSLIEVGKSQKEIGSILEQETETFEGVKKAVDNGSLKIGVSKEYVAKEYGDPVVKVPESKDETERWVYKPSSASYFEGTKIYLIFDKDGILKEAKTVEQKSDKKRDKITN